MTPAPVVTSTLIPATQTPTPEPSLTPTATPSEQLPNPAQLIGTQESDTPRFILTPQAGVETDIVQQIVRDLAQHLEIDPRSVHPVTARETVWFDEGARCSAPAGPYPRLLQAVDGVEVTLLAGRLVYEYRLLGDSRLYRCPQTRMIRGELLTAVDPIAAELVALARRQVARRLDLPTRRVQVLDAMTVTWPDTSLGCPQPGQTYSPVSIDGYRIVVSAGDTEYIYHTDSVSLYPCDAAEECLPDDPDGCP